MLGPNPFFFPRPWALALSVAALIAMFHFKAGAMQVLAACSVAGIALYLAGLVTP